MLRKIELPLVILISIFVIFTNILPFLYRLTTTPPDRKFLGTNFYTLDFNIYLGHFKEGAEGTFRIHDKHTSEPHTGFLLRREYWLWGYIFGHLFRLPTWVLYHSARITGGFALLSLTYILIRRIFSSPLLRVTAFTLATLVAGFPKIIIDPTTGKKSIDLYLYWFLELDPANRFATLFHYLVGNCLLLTFILLSTKLFHQRSGHRKHVWLLQFGTWIFTGLASGLSHPSTLATIYLLIPVYLLLRLTTFVASYLWHTKSLFVRQLARETVLLALFAILTLPIVPLVSSQTRTFPWDEIARWDLASQTPIDFHEYTLALGPNYFLAIIGIIVFLAVLIHHTPHPTTQSATAFTINPTTSTLLLLLLSFTTSTFLWVFRLYPFLPTVNRIRFMQVPIFIPLAIFATITLSHFTTFTALLLRGLYSSLSRLIPKTTNPHQSSLSLQGKLISGTRSIVLLFSLLYIVYLTYPAYHWGLYREYHMFPPGDLLVHTFQPLFEAYTWLDQFTRPQDVVLASFYSATLLPGQTGNTSYWGHPWSTVNFDTKAKLVERFYRTQMAPSEARAFLATGHIVYVLHDFQSRDYHGDLTKYLSFLTPVFDNHDNTIYRFTP